VQSSSRSTSQRVLRPLGAGLGLVLVLQSSVAWSAPANTKLIMALYAAAQKEFDAGNFERAAELFLNIYQQDPSQPTALYNAARSAHLAGKLDRAEDLYSRYEALPAAEAAKLEKIKGLRGEILVKRGEMRADEANAAERTGQYAVALQLWTDAVRFNPSRSAWWARAGRAAQLAGRVEDARSWYQRVLNEAAAAAPERADAQRWEAELPPVAAAAAPSKVAETGIASGESAPTAVPSKLPGMALAGLGGAAVLAGGVVLLLAQGDQAELDSQLATRDASGGITGITKAKAVEEASRISSNYNLGWGLAGGGLVVAGIGTWWLLRNPQKTVRLVPTGNGVQLAWSF
jgi:tetratricopeptide (TPR) repeat protein